MNRHEGFVKRIAVVILIILASACENAQGQAPAQYVPPPALTNRELPHNRVLGAPPPVFRLQPFPPEQRGLTDSTVQRPRVGINRPLPADALTIGEWIKDAADQHRWHLRIQADGATGIRLHFTHFSVGSGKIWIHDSSGSDQVFGPYTGKGWFGDGDFWTEMIFGDSVDLEYSSSEKYVEVLPFQIEELFHYWVGAPDRPTINFDSIATDCFLDAMCYDSTSYVHKGTLATMFLITPDGFTCTGTMVNDRNSANVRYMLTAGHCVNTDSNARGMLVIFGYSTPSCVGNFTGWTYQLNPWKLPQVSGATLLKWSVHFGPSGTSIVADAPDFAFLQLSQQPPAAFVYSGWSFSTNIGETLYSLSHPRGLPKVYARGLVTASIANDFFQASMVEGRADHGSSGSGVFDDSVHLRGLLSTGASAENVSACTLSSDSHRYTRFSSIYPQISQWLEGTSSIDTTPPQLTIASHYDGQMVSTSSITLSGTASDGGRGNNGISLVTVNGARANGDTAIGSGTASWSRTLTLSNGSNTITVITKDNSSNQNAATISITINLSVPTQPQASTYHVFPQVVDGQSNGASYISLLTVTNLTRLSTTCAFASVGLSSSRFVLDPSQTIRSGTTFVDATSGKGSLATGYATVTCSQPVQASLSYFFGLDDKTVSMATVFSAPPITYATIPVLTGIGWRYGIAIANTNASDISILFSLTTSTGEILKKTIQISGQSQYVGFLDRLLNLPSVEGLNVLEMTSASPFSVTALLFDGAAFTTLVPAIKQ